MTCRWYLRAACVEGEEQSSLFEDLKMKRFLGRGIRGDLEGDIPKGFLIFCFGDILGEHEKLWWRSYISMVVLLRGRGSVPKAWTVATSALAIILPFSRSSPSCEHSISSMLSCEWDLFWNDKPKIFLKVPVFPTELPTQGSGEKDFGRLGGRGGGGWDFS